MLTALDWLVLTLVMLVPVVVGLRHYRRAGAGLGEFFLSGRDLPWWLAGTSMVATTFAADTPLAVTGLVVVSGIAGNWLWWNAALGSVLTVFFFSRLWRRAGVLTDVEFTELRYAGRPAAALRGLRALYMGLPINCLIIGWVNLALAKVLSITLGWDRLTAVFVGLAATGVYSAAAGLRGVVLTDLFQFGLAMVGSVALAWFALSLPAVGGLSGLRDALPAETFQLLPAIGGETTTTLDVTALALPLTAFIAYVGVQWWASWYPGQEPGGGGYIAQRMMSSRSEQDALAASLWFTVAHYCLRPWPWILVALATLVVYPGLADAESGYALMMRDHLPAGWRGLLVGTFFAAYMSTVSTQLNWGASYLVNDVYARFVRPHADPPELVRVSRGVTVALMLLSGVVTFYLESVRQAWQFALESGAGVGLVLILRWYWWRVSALSEIAALVASALGFLLLRGLTDIEFPISLLYLVPWTTAGWLLVTAVTRPEPMTHLVAFHRRVSPAGPGWKPVVDAGGLPAPPTLTQPLREWVAGCVSVYGVLLGVGSALFGSPWVAVGLLTGASVGTSWLWRRYRSDAPTRSSQSS